MVKSGFPGGSGSKKICLQCGRPGFDQVSCFKVQVIWTVIKDRWFINTSTWILGFMLFKMEIPNDICVMYKST